MDNQNPTQTGAPSAAPQYVTRNGAVIAALTSVQVENIINGMLPFDESDAGQLVKGKRDANGNIKQLKVMGNGTHIPAMPNPVSGKLVPESYVYNVNAYSAVAFGTPRAQDALAKAIAAEDAGNIEEQHDGYREFLNRITVSFNLRQQSLVNGQLVQGVLSLITTEKGKLLKLENVTAIQAVVATGTTKRVSVRSLLTTVAAGEEPQSAVTPTVAAAFAAAEDAG